MRDANCENCGASGWPDATIGASENNQGGGEPGSIGFCVRRNLGVGSVAALDCTASVHSHRNSCKTIFLTLLRILRTLAP